MAKINESVKQKILDAISSANYGATITEIEKIVKYERHTVSKYLSALKGEGLIDLKIAGKAKLWFINKAPLQKITRTAPESRSYLENMLLKLLSNLPVGVVVVDRDYNIQFADESIKETYGAVEDLKFYKEILGLENPLRLTKLTSILDYTTIKKDTIVIEDKKERILSIKASKIENPDCSLSLILMIEDITEDILTEEENKKLSRAVEQTADMVMITDKEGTIEYVNPAFEIETGYKKNEILGKKPSILKSGKHPQRFYQKMWVTILSGKPYHGLVVDKKKNGQLLFEQKTITPIFDGKKITHFVSTGKVLAEQPVTSTTKKRLIRKKVG